MTKAWAWLKRRIWIPVAVALTFAGAALLSVFGSSFRRKKILGDDREADGYLDALEEQHAQIEERAEALDQRLEQNTEEQGAATRRIRRLPANDMEDDLNDAFYSRRDD